MAKNRRKRRRKRRGGQAAAPPPQVQRPSRVAPEERPDVVAARPGGPGSEGTVVGTVVEVERESIWIEVGGQRAVLYASELMLGIGERPADRYAVADRFEAFVFQMEPDPESGATQFSIRRAYPEALAGLEVGVEVQATVVNTYDAGIELDVGGVRGNIFVQGLPLSVGKSTHQNYQPGGQIIAHIHRISVDDRELVLSVRQYAPGYMEALQRRAVGDVVSATITGFQPSGGLWLDVDGLVGGVLPRELALNDGESAQEHYAVGETVDGLLVWQVDHTVRTLSLSVKRNAPGYVETLQRRAVGDVVSGIVTAFQPNGGFWLDVDGLVGGVPLGELALADGESAQDRYAVGEMISDLFVWRVAYEFRALVLSVKRNASGYVEAFHRRAVGDVVSGIVTDFSSNGGFRLNVDGLVGSIVPWEITLADEESARERYAVGETIDGLVVWQVNHENRSLALSAKRNAPGYLEALRRHAVGDVLSGTVAGFQSNGGLWLDVDGLAGSIALDELVLNDGNSARERYAVGETIDDLFVWQVDYEDRDLSLSVKRNAPGYLDALDAIARGDEIDGIVAKVNESGVWLGAAGVVGWIPTSELLLDDRESPQTRYTVGDPITARVWLIDHEARDISLSVRRLAADFAEGPIEQGAEISVTVRGTTPRDVRMPIRVLTMYSVSGVKIPPHELSLSMSMPSRFEDGQAIRTVVTELDDRGRPMRLSHRRALNGWNAEMRRLSHNTLVPNASPVPPEALSDAEFRAGTVAVDLGPITGFVPEEEIDREAGRNVATYNETYPVVIESVDHERGIAAVSRDRFEGLWRELATSFEVGAEVAGELREVEGRVALLDLGSGLLAEMPVEQLPARAEGDGVTEDRIGETVTVRIKSIEAETYTITAEIKNYELVQMIAGNESATCEFKAVFQGQREGDSKEVRSGYPVARAMAGMMNRDGGHVLVGVYEDPETKKGVVIGWEESGFDTEDGFVNELSKVVGEMLSTEAGGLYGVRFEALPSGKRIVDIECRRAERPIFAKKAWVRRARAEFFVRYEGATRRPADDRELYEYIMRRFYGRDA